VAPEVRFILFQAIIILPFIAGSFLKSRLDDPSRIAKKLLTLNIYCLDPAIILWSIWGLSFSFSMLILPLAGLFLVTGGFASGKLLSPLLSGDSRRKSIFTISSSLANHGFTMGGFLCYLFMGERGLGLSSLFLLYFTPYTFLFIFPYSRMASAGASGRMPGIRQNLLTLQNMPLYAALSALLLHGLGIHRPVFAFPLDVLLMLSIGLYYLTLGMNFSFGRILAVKQEHFFLGLIKFIMLPLITLVIVNLFSLDHDIKTVILLESCMPAAIYSVVSAVLFDLDPEAASSMFVVNTLAFIMLVLPLLFVLMPWIH